ncbi:hypothetical protein HOD08_03755, partial [bacterium]|nr:hypothetical protein [bacterium]
MTKFRILFFFLPLTLIFSQQTSGEISKKTYIGQWIKYLQPELIKQHIGDPRSFLTSILKSNKIIRYGDKVRMVHYHELKDLRAGTGVEIADLPKGLGYDPDEHLKWLKASFYTLGAAGLKKDAVEIWQNGLKRINDFKVASMPSVSTYEENSVSAANYWIIKGPHHDEDLWNSPTGMEVKSGDIIRLENAYTKKNLRIVDKSIETGGTEGIGNESDNWRVRLSGGSRMIWGVPFRLTHIESGKSLALTNSRVVATDTEHQDVETPDDPDADADEAANRLTTLQSEQAALLADANAKAGAETPGAATPPPLPKKKPSIIDGMDPTELQRIWGVIDARPTPPPEEDVAWTGAPFGAPAGKTDWSRLSIEIDKLGMGGGIAPKSTQDFAAMSAMKKPSVSGFAKDTIQQFDASFTLKINPLLSKGASWLGKSLKKPGQATLFFRAKPEDKGNIQVVFGKDVGIDFVWKIIIGGWDNTKSAIVKRHFEGGKAVDDIVKEVTPDESPLAQVEPGTYIPYWVSIDEGHILVGAGGSIGQNVFMSWKDPNPPKGIRRAGFSTHKTPVTYAEIQIRNKVQPTPPARIFHTSKDTVVVEPGNDLTVFNKPLRVPGRGAMSFKVKGDEGAIIAFMNDEDDNKARYEAVFGGFGVDSGIMIRKYNPDTDSYTTLSKVKTTSFPEAQISDKSFRQFWMSVHYGQIAVGAGRLGKNVIIATQDFEPFRRVGSIAFGTTGKGGASFKSISISSPVKLSPEKKEESYERSKELFAYKGDMQIILPFEYRIEQEGQSIKFTDVINNKTFYPGGTPQQDAQYFFMLTIRQDGFPQIDWTTEPLNPKKLEMEKSAHKMRALGDAFLQASMSVQGGGVVGSLIGVGLSAGFAGAGIGIAGEAAAAKEAGLMGFRGHDSYVFTDKINTNKLGESDIPPEAQVNRAKIEQKIELGGKWSPSSREKLERLVLLYRQSINMINHPFVVQDQYIRKSIFEAVDSMYEGHKALYPKVGGAVEPGSEPSYNSLLNLLISAYNNAYLVNADNVDQSKRKDSWLVKINELARYLLQGHASAGLTLRPYFGEYIWLEEHLPEKSSGTILFEARGLNDIFVAFGQRPFKTRNSDNEIYEVVIGGWDNTKTVIRVQSLDQSVKEFTNKEFPEAMINPLEFQKYWISTNKGEIVVGKGDIAEENVVLRWQDPYPVQRLKYVGLSTWNTPVTYRNVY